jgi:hypothetical protein
MLSIDLGCLIIALVFFALAAFSVPSGRFNLTAAGLFFLTLQMVV